MSCSLAVPSHSTAEAFEHIAGQALNPGCLPWVAGLVVLLTVLFVTCCCSRYCCRSRQTAKAARVVSATLSRGNHSEVKKRGVELEKDDVKPGDLGLATDDESKPIDVGDSNPPEGLYLFSNVVRGLTFSLSEPLQAQRGSFRYEPLSSTEDLPAQSLLQQRTQSSTSNLSNWRAPILGAESLPGSSFASAGTLIMSSSHPLPSSCSSIPAHAGSALALQPPGQAWSNSTPQFNFNTAHAWCQAGQFPNLPVSGHPLGPLQKSTYEKKAGPGVPVSVEVVVPSSAVRSDEYGEGHSGEEPWRRSGLRCLPRQYFREPKLLRCQMRLPDLRHLQEHVREMMPQMVKTGGVMWQLLFRLARSHVDASAHLKLSEMDEGACWDSYIASCLETATVSALCYVMTCAGPPVLFDSFQAVLPSCRVFSFYCIERNVVHQVVFSWP